jgi:hypothetical protein
MFTEEYIKREMEKQISELIEEQKTEFVFNGQFLYILGRGHDFLYGFFTEYITKTGIKARRYSSGIWYIDNNLYDYKNSEFIKRPKLIINTESVDFSEISLPIIQKSFPKLLANDLVSVKPNDE